MARYYVNVALRLKYENLFMVRKATVTRSNANSVAQTMRTKEKHLQRRQRRCRVTVCVCDEDDDDDDDDEDDEGIFPTNPFQFYFIRRRHKNAYAITLKPFQTEKADRKTLAHTNTHSARNVQTRKQKLLLQQSPPASRGERQSDKVKAMTAKMDIKK